MDYKKKVPCVILHSKRAAKIAFRAIKANQERGSETAQETAQYYALRAVPPLEHELHVRHA